VERVLAQRRDATPAQIAQALASAAEGMRARGDAAGALRLLRDQKRVRLREPDAAPALREFVAIAREAGQSRAALALAREAVAAHPDAATSHELLGRALEASGAPRDEVGAAYARAVDLDANNAGALLGLARLAADPAEALALFDRASAADPEDAEGALGGARALVAAGRAHEAEARLQAALPKHPLAPELAAELADLRVARGDFSDATLAAARRPVVLGGSPEAWERFSRVHRGRGDAEKADEAMAHARAAREPGE
jgi:tetratricopeptide (TPR) repeat protein